MKDSGKQYGTNWHKSKKAKRLLDDVTDDNSV